MPARGRRIRFSDIRWQTTALIAAAVIPCATRAGECGLQHPDYQAERVVTVGDSIQRMTVYSAGMLVREETETPDGMRVTIRDTQLGRTIVRDPRTGRSVVLPLPPQRPGPAPTRTLDETGPGDSLVRIVQIRRGSAWLDLARITCRSDGIMTRQTFISLDPRGREVEGTLVQDRIRVGPLSPDLFRLTTRTEPSVR